MLQRRWVPKVVEAKAVGSDDVERRFTVAPSDRYLRGGGSLEAAQTKIEVCGRIVFVGFADRPLAVVIGDGFGPDLIAALACNDVFLTLTLGPGDRGWLESLEGRRRRE